MPVTQSDAGNFVSKYWPILAAIVVLILALGETRWQVRQLIRDRSHEEIQDARLDALDHPIVDHEARLEAIENHTKPETIQAWGAVQSDVRRHEIEINRLESRAHTH
jgi:hypothetical protein